MGGGVGDVESEMRPADASLRQDEQDRAGSGDRIGYILRTVDSGIVIAEGYSINTGAQGSMSGQTNLSTPMTITSVLCIDRTVGNVIGGTRTWIRGFLFRFK